MFGFVRRLFARRRPSERFEYSDGVVTRSVDPDAALAGLGRAGLLAVRDAAVRLADQPTTPAAARRWCRDLDDLVGVADRVLGLADSPLTTHQKLVVLTRLVKTATPDGVFARLGPED